MRVRRVTKDGDWTFGKSKADYAVNSDAIRQNVVTRLREFTNDWFPDVKSGIDWFGLLGSLGNETAILRAVEKTILDTDGVTTITKLRLLGVDKNRSATIEISFTDIFQQSTDIQESIGV